MSVAFAVGVLVPTMLLVARHGAVGAALGWTIGNAIAGVLALLASRLPERGSGEHVQTAAAATTLTDYAGSRLAASESARLSGAWRSGGVVPARQLCIGKVGGD